MYLSSCSAWKESSTEGAFAVPIREVGRKNMTEVNMLGYLIGVKRFQFMITKQDLSTCWGSFRNFLRSIPILFIWESLWG